MAQDQIPTADEFFGKPTSPAISGANSSTASRDVPTADEFFGKPATPLPAPNGRPAPKQSPMEMLGEGQEIEAQGNAAMAPIALPIAAGIAGETLGGPLVGAAGYLGTKALVNREDIKQHPWRTAAETAAMVVAPYALGKVAKWGEPLANKVGEGGKGLLDYLTTPGLRSGSGTIGSTGESVVGVSPAPASSTVGDSTADTIGHWAEPNPPAPGVNPQTTYSVPRADLEEMARRGDPGAAERLMEQGKRGLVIPRGAGEGYPGPRPNVVAPDAPEAIGTLNVPPRIARAGGYGPKKLIRPTD